MFRYQITQTGPALGSGEVCYMCGRADTPEHKGVYVGGYDCPMEAIDALKEHINKDCASTNQGFTIEYFPWKE
jgi:hypothetical protein